MLAILCLYIYLLTQGKIIGLKALSLPSINAKTFLNISKNSFASSVVSKSPLLVFIEVLV